MCHTQHCVIGKMSKQIVSIEIVFTQPSLAVQNTMLSILQFQKGLEKISLLQS